MGYFQNFLFSTLCSFPAILIAITVQGYAKAKMADKLGDKLPRFQGRVSLNPSAHIDVLGLVMLILIKFGWTKPVEINPGVYKNGKNDLIKVSVAPLIGNFITAFIFSFIYGVVFYFVLPYMPIAAASVLDTMLYLVVSINISLMVFNLIPLPGLCGWSILQYVSPKTFFKISDKIYQYQTLILLFIVLIGGQILGYPVYLIVKLLLSFVSMIFGIFI